MARPGQIFIRLILAAVVVVLVALAAIVFSLKHGVSRDTLSIGPVQIENLSLQLEKKLSLDIAKLRITSLPSDADTDSESKTKRLDPSTVRDALNGISLLANIFSRIDIRLIEAGKLEGSFSYRENAPGHLDVHSPRADIALDLGFENDQLVVDIEQLRAPDYGVEVSGEIRLYPLQRELHAKLHAVIADTLPVKLEIKADSRKLSFTGRGQAPVKTIAPIIDLTGLGPGITVWILDDLQASEFILDTVSGSLSYDNPGEILQTLHAEASVKDVAYTFAQGVAPVVAKDVKVVFDKGVLDILPRNATFYGQDAGSSSYVDIDFNKAEVLLGIYLRTRAQASGGILTLLEHYDIPFPYEQVEGLTDVDLSLLINLATEDIHATGDFQAVDGVFRIGEQSFDVADLDVALKADTVDIKKIELSLPDLFSAKIVGQIDMSTGKGDLQISPRRFSTDIDGRALALFVPPGEPPVIHYRTGPQGHRVELPATRWHYGELRVDVAAMTTPLDLAAGSGKLPPTQINVEGLLHAVVSGDYRSKAPFADLNIELLEFHGKSLVLEQPRAQFKLQFGKVVKLWFASPIMLSLNSIGVELQPSLVRYDKGVLSIIDSGLRVAPGLSTGLRGDLDFGRGIGQLYLSGLELKGSDGAALLKLDNRAEIRMSSKADEFHLSSAELGVAFVRKADGGWKIEVADLASLHSHSPLLQRFALDNGQFQLSSANGTEPYLIAGSMEYQYPLLIVDSAPVNDYHFTGEFGGEALYLDINEGVNIVIEDGVEMHSVGVGYNLPAILDLLEAPGGSEQQPVSEQADSVDPVPATNKRTGTEAGGLDFRLFATDSEIGLGDKYKVLADSLELRYSGGETRVELHHIKGRATLKMVGDQVEMRGKGFGQEFLENIITLSDFEGGEMEFGLKGAFNEFDAGLRITDTVLVDFKMLNNMLAFINTLPGLLTFKPPHYDTQGLPTKEIYAAVHFKDKLLDLTSLLIDSDELDLQGTGWIDFNKDTTDITFNLVTGAAESVKKIPVLGYILAGDEDKNSVSLMVKGDLHSPEVSNTAAREVVTYPLQLIGRTLLWPEHAVKKMADESQGEPD